DRLLEPQAALEVTLCELAHVDREARRRRRQQRLAALRVVDLHALDVDRRAVREAERHRLDARLAAERRLQASDRGALESVAERASAEDRRDQAAEDQRDARGELPHAARALVDAGDAGAARHDELLGAAGA